MRLLDQRVQDISGFPEAILVENAGRSLWEWIRNSGLIKLPVTRLLILAGGGNNGADALVAARHAAGHPALQIQVITLGKLQRVLPLMEASLLAAWGITCSEFIPGQDLPPADILVDGLLGTGFVPPLRPDYKELLEKIQEHPGVRLAVDIPSGLSPGSSHFLPVDHTLTLGYPKQMLYYPAFRTRCGTIHHLEVGFPPGMGEQEAPGRLLSESDLPELLPVLDPGVYKNRRGHVAILGGAPGTSGAPVMAARGASAARCGLVTVLVPSSVYPSAAAHLQAQMVLSWDDFDGHWDRFDALVMGPGWKVTPDSVGVLKRALGSGVPVVLDAGALDLVPHDLEQAGIPNLNNCVLTPHPGEFARMTGLPVSDILQNPLEPMTEFSRRWKCWLILKASTVFVMSPEGRFWVCDGLNPAMASGGSGDVLAGILGSTLIQCPTWEGALNAGVLLHQLSGKEAWHRWGWFEPSKLPDAAAAVLKEINR